MMVVNKHKIINEENINHIFNLIDQVFSIFSKNEIL